MESALVVTVGLLVLLGGTVTLLSKQRVLPWSMPALRTIGGTHTGTESELEPNHTGSPGSDGGVEPMLAGPTAVVQPVVMEASEALSGDERFNLPEPFRLDLVSSSTDAFAARLARIEERLDEIARRIEQQPAELTQELRRAQADLARRTEVDDARRDAALEQLRADVLSAISRVGADGNSRSGAKRPEVSADLYGRLARLEAALAAVTNPILLPGESYAPPAEFLPEALVWENWNEVGERAFSLADAYSAQRLHLSDETRGKVDLFVTSLRTLLTRSVYPNLQPEPDATQQVALRAALEEIASELATARQELEREYREGRSM